MSAPQGDLRTIELVAVRLGDDLGALIAAMEAALPPQSTAPLPRLADALAARLHLLLAALRPPAGALPLAELTALAKGLPEGVQLELDLVQADTVFAPVAGRVLLNLLLMAAEALPEGGTIRLAGTADDLFVQIDGPRAAWPAGLAVCVVNPAEARLALHGGQHLRMALASVLAHEAGIRLSAVYPASGGAAPAILRMGGT